MSTLLNNNFRTPYCRVCRHIAYPICKNNNLHPLCYQPKNPYQIFKILQNILITPNMSAQTFQNICKVIQSYRLYVSKEVHVFILHEVRKEMRNPNLSEYIKDINSTIEIELTSSYKIPNTDIILEPRTELQIQAIGFAFEMINHEPGCYFYPRYY